MIIAQIKRMIPSPVKVRIKKILGIPPAAPAKASVRTAPMRPCARRWPSSQCECEMQLAPSKQLRLHRRITKALRDSDITYVDRLDESEFHLAINVRNIDEVKEILSKGALEFTAKTRPTRINDYDFPRLRTGLSLSSALPNEYEELSVTLPIFCKQRKLDVLNASVLISSYTEIDGVRLFHSNSATSRARDIRAPKSSQPITHNRVLQEPIDVVITTVDGSDPVWQEKYEHTRSRAIGEETLAKTSNSARFTSHDELRFVLRSLHHYAPYLRTIHLVTDAQVPEWLDASHPKINLVDHKDIIDAEYLPTFNSDSIESFLWKIPGLSERFLYFNDDVLLAARTTERTFFTEYGIPQFFDSPRRIPDIPLELAESYTTHAHLRSSIALERRGFSRPKYKYKHAPFAVQKSILQEMEDEFPSELHQTRSSPFRSEESFATISFLYPNFALASGRAVTSPLRYRYVDISRDNWRERLLSGCKQTDCTVMCINESNDALDDDTLDQTLHGILASRFPVVPPWEMAHSVNPEGVAT